MPKTKKKSNINLHEYQAKKILAIDAKVILDDNALFRHMDYKEMYDEKEYSIIELDAKKAGLNYLKLDGEVACMVNGAGLAMSTMDMIKLYGANPANFLDLGGKADSKCIKNSIISVTSLEEAANKIKKIINVL